MSAMSALHQPCQHLVRLVHSFASLCETDLVHDPSGFLTPEQLMLLPSSLFVFFCIASNFAHQLQRILNSSYT